MISLLKNLTCDDDGSPLMNESDDETNQKFLRTVLEAVALDSFNVVSEFQDDHEPCLVCKIGLDGKNYFVALWWLDLRKFIGAMTSKETWAEPLLAHLKQGAKDFLED
jgi:hypothetical protein